MHSIIEDFDKKWSVVYMMSGGEHRTVKDGMLFNGAAALCSQLNGGVPATWIDENKDEEELDDVA